MPASKAKIRANAKYNKNHYDRIDLRLPKGEKEVVKSHAIKHDGSLNKFLNRAINEAMERDKEKENNY